MSGDDEENQQTKGSDKQSWLEQNPAKRSLWPKKQDGSHEPFSSRYVAFGACQTERCSSPRPYAITSSQIRTQDGSNRKNPKVGLLSC